MLYRIKKRIHDHTNYELYFNLNSYAEKYFLRRSTITIDENHLFYDNGDDTVRFDLMSGHSVPKDSVECGWVDLCLLEPTIDCQEFWNVL